MGKKSNIYMSNLEEELNEVVPTVLQSIINIFMVRQVGQALITSKIY